jgi:hypothetical protein
MSGWIWLARAKRWIGCGDLQDGMLKHYQELVPLTDWAFERKVEAALEEEPNPVETTEVEE